MYITCRTTGVCINICHIHIPRAIDTCTVTNVSEIKWYDKYIIIVIIHNKYVMMM